MNLLSDKNRTRQQEPHRSEKEKKNISCLQENYDTLSFPLSKGRCQRFEQHREGQQQMRKSSLNIIVRKNQRESFDFDNGEDL